MTDFWSPLFESCCPKGETPLSSNFKGLPSIFSFSLICLRRSLRNESKSENSPDLFRDKAVVEVGID